METYKGMRWFKCDLHMHTPVRGSGWRGSKFAGDSSEDMKKYALEYAQYCYNLGLEVVAVTEHNFLAKDFLPLLKQAFAELSSEYGYEIVMFPGFEFEADVGKGMHVICVFEPDMNLEHIDHILTECGVDWSRINSHNLAKSTLRLPEIINIVQRNNENGYQRGLVIVPHVFEDSLFDNDRVSEWIQQIEYLNSDLLAIEVPKPVSQMSSGFQKLFAARDDCAKEWRRERPIATIMSSDCKALSSAEDNENYIGFRYTWIKMSQPSIEALRQAFLDNRSRILLPGEIPWNEDPNAQKYSRIISVSVNGAEYLENQTIMFSPNLNCIIGGRGTGKSTIIEAIRLALGKEEEPKVDSGTKEKIKRIKEALKKNPDTSVQIHWSSQDGIEDVITYSTATNDFRVEDRELVDLEAFLDGIPVHIFSQQQLNQMTQKSGNMLLSLLNDFCYEDVQNLETKERSIQNEIINMFSKQHKLEQINNDIARVTQELQELERQWSIRSELQEEAKIFKGCEAAKDYVEKTEQGIKYDGDRLLSIADEIRNDHLLLDDNEVNGWPEADWFRNVDERIKLAKENLHKDIETAINKYRNSVRGIIVSDERWPGLRTMLIEAQSRFQEACQEKGITSDDVSRLQEIDEQRKAKMVEKKLKEDERKLSEQEAGGLSGKFRQLHDIWRSIYEVRKNMADKVNRTAYSDDRNGIEVLVDYSSSQAAYAKIWDQLYTDRRTRLGRNWEDIGIVFFDFYKNNISDYPSVWEMVQRWLNNPMEIPAEINEKLAELRFEFDGIREYLTEDGRQQWEGARILRVEDQVDMILYHPEGTEAGRISDGSLSDGQRNTAALLLLLAEGTDPLILDQPEDELDSNFIYHELVPMLRELKRSRQIILVTHNANLPVNGDADLVYALETRHGHGRMLASGGLDRSHVSNAVLEIMEGSKPAFVKRQEKYGF